MLKRWYRNASMRAPNPSWTDIEKVRGYFQNLYQWGDPHTPDLILATHVDLVQVKDATPSEADMEASFHRLFPLKACRHTHLRAEHFKQWLREAYPGENSKTPTQAEC